MFRFGRNRKTETKHLFWPKQSPKVRPKQPFRCETIDNCPKVQSLALTTICILRKSFCNAQSPHYVYANDVFK